MSRVSAAVMKLTFVTAKVVGLQVLIPQPESIAILVHNTFTRINVTISTFVMKTRIVTSEKLLLMWTAFMNLDVKVNHFVRPLGQVRLLAAKPPCVTPGLSYREEARL